MMTVLLCRCFNHRWSDEYAGFPVVFAGSLEIQVGIAKGLSDSAIGVVVSAHRTTVLREVRAGGGRARYCSEAAQARSGCCARRPKELRLSSDAVLRVEV